MENDMTKRSALLVAALSSFLTPFMGSSTNIALPSIGLDFSMDAVALSWVATAYLLSSAIFLVPFGRIADIHGRKRVFLLGMWIYSFGTVLCVLSFDGSSLIAFRVLQGLGAAMIFGTGIAILTSVFPPGERGKALGMTVAIVYVGLSSGPFLGGFLTQTLGWRSIFWVTLPLSAAIIYIGSKRLRGEWGESKGESFDLPGALMYSLSLTSVMLGFSLLPRTSALLLTVLGGLGMLGLVWWELRIPDPLLNIRLFRYNKAFTLSNLAALINYGATFAVGFLMSLYLQYSRGLTPGSAGVILVSQPIVMAVLSPLAGRLSDKIAPGLIASAGMSVTVVGLVLLAAISDDTSIGYIVVGLATIGLGIALFSSPNTNAIMSSVDRRLYGVASASVGTMRLVGQVLSLGVAMIIFALLMGDVEITPELYPSFLRSAKIALSIFALLCFCGIFASLGRVGVKLRLGGSSG